MRSSAILLLECGSTGGRDPDQQSIHAAQHNALSQNQRIEVASPLCIRHLRSILGFFMCSSCAITRGKEPKRSDGGKEMSEDKSTFRDSDGVRLSKYEYRVHWAVGNGITDHTNNLLNISSIGLGSSKRIARTDSTSSRLFRMSAVVAIPPPPATPLGSSIPPLLPHAISVSLPTWKANIGYEEGEKWVVEKMQTGYPRFFIHRSIQKVSVASGWRGMPVVSPCPLASSQGSASQNSGRPRSTARSSLRPK